MNHTKETHNIYHMLIADDESSGYDIPKLPRKYINVKGTKKYPVPNVNDKVNTMDTDDNREAHTSNAPQSSTKSHTISDDINKRFLGILKKKHCRLIHRPQLACDICCVLLWCCLYSLSCPHHYLHKSFFCILFVSFVFTVSSLLICT